MDIRYLSKEEDGIKAWCMCDCHCIEFSYDRDHKIWDIIWVNPTDKSNLWRRIKIAWNFVFGKQALDWIHLSREQMRKLITEIQNIDKG